MRLALLNPISRTCPIFRTRRDANLTLAIYRQASILAATEFGLRFHPKIDMTDEVGKFFAIADSPNLVEAHPVIEDDGTKFLRLYESKLIWQFDHRYGTFNDCSKHDIMAGEARRLTDAELEDPNLFCLPHYYAPVTLVGNRYSDDGMVPRWLLTVRRLTNTTNERTAIFAIVPECGCGNSMFAFNADSLSNAIWLLASGNSFVFDYCTRNKVGGTNFLQFIIEQLPVLPPATYAQPCEWTKQPQTVQGWVLPRVLELTYTAWTSRRSR